MRHMEAIMRTSVMVQGEVMRNQTRMIERLAQQNEVLQAKHMETIELIEELHSKKHEREVKTIEVAAKVERENEVASKLMLLAPVVVNKIAGKKLLPETASPEQIQVDQFLESFTQEQMLKMQSVLSPSQLLVVMELYQAAQQRAEERRKAAQNGTTETKPS
jgi:hypothetical protein